MKPLQSHRKNVRAHSARRSGKRFKLLCAIDDNINPAVIDFENLLEHAIRLWQSGEWELLAKLDCYAVKNHPDRAELFLLAAAGHLQKGNVNEARKCILYGQRWGCSKEKISQILVAGVYNSLGKASAVNGHLFQAFLHYKSSIAIGTPKSEYRLLAKNRIKQDSLHHDRFICKSKQDLENICKDSFSINQELINASESNSVLLGNFNDFSSKEYWENRYKKGGTSGYGSYGRLANFKAKIINKFIIEEGVTQMMEFGCGDGNQLSLINVEKYFGIDISPFIISQCKKKFKGDAGKVFYTTAEYQKKPFKAELTISMDVIFHLVEDDVFVEYMNTLFGSSERYCIIYACDENLFINDSVHVRRRVFTEWIAKYMAGWRLFQTIYNKYPHDGLENPRDTSFSDFYFFERIK